MYFSNYLVAFVGLAVPILGQTVTIDPSGATFLGCYTDSNNRILNGSSASPSTNTIESCHASCASQSFAYSGVEYSSQCFCGNVLVDGNPKANADSECNYACSGNSTEICGGYWRISIYQLSGGSSASSSAASSSSAALSTSSPVQQPSSSTMSIATSQSMAQSSIPQGPKSSSSATSKTSSSAFRLPTQLPTNNPSSKAVVCQKRKAEQARLAKVMKALKVAHESVGPYMAGEWSALVTDSPQTQRSMLAQIANLDQQNISLPPYFEGYLAAFRKVGETVVVNC